MKNKVRVLKPLGVKINLWNTIKLILMVLISILLWIILIVAGIHILVCYIYNIINKGCFDSETMKYSVMLVIGAYLFLIVDKNKISEVLGIKKDLPFLALEQTETNNENEKSGGSGHS